MHFSPPRLGRLLPIAMLLATAGCAERPTTATTEPAGWSPAFAKSGGSGRYQLRFILRDPAIPEGEITSAPFPAGGISLNTNDPWRQMAAEGARVVLTSPTHGTRGLGGCVFAADVAVDWTIAGAYDATGNPRSFAGEWLLRVATSRGNGGVSFYLSGPRMVDGVASASAGSIQNIASNGNHPVETRAPDGVSWFQIEFTNARLGFGSASSPDGQGTLADLPGYETACANFTIRAERMP